MISVTFTMNLLKQGGMYNTNAIASLLYHYTYIVGDIVLIKEGFYNGEMDFVSLSDEE